MIVLRATLLFVLLSYFPAVEAEQPKPNQSQHYQPQPQPQPYQISNSEIRQLTSKINGVTYSLYISLPKGYRKGSEDYPVVFTLDADYSFALAHNIIEHFSDRNNLPKSIVVGIGYTGRGQDAVGYRTNRTRDYTPTFVTTGGYGPRFQKHSGGADKFIEVISKELLPFINNQYASGLSNRTLVGHSFGGLFASYVLLIQPALFQRYIIVSPSLWYDKQKIFALQKQFADQQKDLKARVYWAVGDLEELNGHPMVSQLNAYFNQLKQSQYPGLTQVQRVFKNENHNSIFPTALTTGLRFVFSKIKVSQP